MSALKEMLKGIKTEIGAGMVLSPNNEAEHCWNRASERAKSIIDKYIGGYGLFQNGIEIEPPQPEDDQHG